jgi:hypothetical protein
MRSGDTSGAPRANGRIAPAARAAQGARSSGRDPAVVRRWVEESCATQGVPVKVTDPAALHRVGVLLSAGREPVLVRAARSGAGATGRSAPPASALD